MIAIIDYGMGNLHSVKNALDHLGIENVITSDIEVIHKADKLILPGVGAFYDCMENLRSKGLIEVILERVQAGIPLLGICLGMQVLFEDGYEVKHVKGLGLLKGSVTLMEDPKVKIPHIGWNALNFNHHTSLQNYLPKTPFVYFVHSYRATQLDDANLIAYANYGSLRIPALVQKGNVIGAQFHPEKSAKDGLAILKWFEEEF
ncbi:MAG: imidazole glycerol phosphate synthase subunit HisH [Longicatena sp.]|nr:imidazole glycerol phosphate synthase subunit HisH [Longicatena sp.]